MFFNDQGIIDIDEMVAQEPSFKKIMDDGIVTDDELFDQSQQVIALLHEAEHRFSHGDLQFVKRLFAEASVLSVIYHYHTLQSLNH